MGAENPALISPAASLPGAFAGSPGTQKRRPVNEALSCSGPRDAGEGKRRRPQPEPRTTAEHDRGAAPPTRAICRVVTLPPRSIDSSGSVPPQHKTSGVQYKSGLKKSGAHGTQSLTVRAGVRARASRPFQRAPEPKGWS